MAEKIWLITGCSTGFGRELAKLAAGKGDKVVGTVRKPEHQESLETLSENITAVLMDVTDHATVAAGVQKAIDLHGRIDVLVNNAGYGSLGSVEEVTEEETFRQFDVNVFGALRLIRAVLPHMRQQRSGHILNITSIAGLQGYPGVGIYNGSKFALEGIGEGLAADVRPLGIRVTNVEPGPFRTDWAGRSATFTASKIDDYADSAAKNLDSISGVSGRQKGDPVRAAEAMYALTELDNPPMHLPLGSVAYKRFRAKLQAMSEELDAFAHLGEPTDFPEEVTH
ncbi:NADP-dependent 3-hydroxy acid dehydrogenase YdfG [Catalinimonas alkaloidigena]|uniref:NADP-dependent 3-hydroxy acid dehydrogenase YdfG n=1 Tax=Catalinimonas alkaloidigena TaxID=1075417 RepID=A0A1G9T8E8_9BACT|nr:oxidoreductase [Catalinimonas alkaloidigena]SDM43927.1 NADP-dependent 3-hydroxy acid dehydrogenase YdfG [Catalinimonas alkaloidigena]